MIDIALYTTCSCIQNHNNGKVNMSFISSQRIIEGKQICHLYLICMNADRLLNLIRNVNYETEE